MSAFIAFFKSVLGNFSDHSASDCDMNINTDVALYNEQDDRFQLSDLSEIFGAGVTNYCVFEQFLHGSSLNREYSAEVPLE